MLICQILDLCSWVLLSCFGCTDVVLDEFMDSMDHLFRHTNEEREVEIAPWCVLLLVPLFGGVVLHRLWIMKKRVTRVIIRPAVIVSAAIYSCVLRNSGTYVLCVSPGCAICAPRGVDLGWFVPRSIRLWDHFPNVTSSVSHV